MKDRIAVLSNINMNFVIRMLQKELCVYEAEGYGNELGTLLNTASSYHEFSPEITFVVMDLMELLSGDVEEKAAGERIEDWFVRLEAALSMAENKGIFYLSDVYLWGVQMPVLADAGRKQRLEQLWQERLSDICLRHKNVRIFPYRSLIEQLGEERAFSLKMWYLGKILLNNEAQKRLCDSILDKVRIEGCSQKDGQVYMPKKVLLLDLDNTLWGGLAGEAEHTPVELSEEHGGLAYKNLQRVILQMQRQGVLLGIISKNNPQDVRDILERHPHMVLRPEHFAVQKINWERKTENIRAIGEELNLGLDSFVFFDDNPAERQLVKELLPMVEVPDFPDRPEELAPAMAEIYRRFFARPVVTLEDRDKTKQYADNVKRSHLRESAGSYEDYLKKLAMVLKRVEPGENIERLTQLVNKTNQFNLTTLRLSQSRLQQMLAEKQKRVFLYQVTDCFGDNGQVAAVIVDTAAPVPVVAEFVMSCRVMGRNLEDAILDDVEQELAGLGYERLRGRYVPTLKNRPVAELYSRLGYEKVAESEGGTAEYEIEIAKAPKRVYYVEKA